MNDDENWCEKRNAPEREPNAFIVFWSIVSIVCSMVSRKAQPNWEEQIGLGSKRVSG